jgi:hypothetical protein
MEASPAPRPTLPVVATAVWGVLLFPGLVGAALSPMFFDAPGSMNNPAAWTNAMIIVSFPLLCLISIAGSWIAWSFRKRSMATGTPYAGLALALLPALPIAYVAAVMSVGTIGVLTSGQPLGLHSTIIKQ